MTTPEITQLVLAQWRLDASMIRALLSFRHAARTARQEVIGVDRMQPLPTMLRRDLPHAYLSKTIDLATTCAGDEACIFQNTSQANPMNPMGSVLGTLYTALLDSAFGCAANALMPLERASATTRRSVNLVCNPTEGKEPLRAIGKILRRSKPLATEFGCIIDAASKL